MGTIKSNDIVLKILSSPISAKIGDTITYIIQIIVPIGISVGNVQLKDTFPNEVQKFIPGSVLLNGQSIDDEIIPFGGLITFPIIKTIDATSKEVIQIYSFDVRIISAKESVNYVDKQINSAKVTWDNNTTGSLGIVTNQQNSVDITMPYLQVRKFQNNITKDTGNTIENINFSSVDTLNYKISVTNIGLNTAYNVVVKDTISTCLSINNNSLSGTKGEGSFNGNNLTWNVPILAIGEMVIINFNAVGGASVPALDIVQNVANAVCNTNNNEFGKNLSNVTSNSVQLDINNLSLSVTPSKTIGLIGDTVKYTIVFSVYKGTILDDAQLKSIIPISQEYVPNSATKQINSNISEDVVPNINSTSSEYELTFTSIKVDASTQNIIIKYIFDTKIVSGMLKHPYVESQNVNVSVNWSAGSLINKVIDSTTVITVKSSDIIITKEQKNFNTNGEYTIGRISATIGDTIYYKITVNSKGAVGGYNLQLRDVLSNNLNFANIITNPSIGTVNNPMESASGIVQWNITNIDAGQTAVYEFSVQLNDITPLDSILSNSIIGQYSSDNSNTKVYDLTSNTSEIDTTGVILNVSAPTAMVIGDKPKYTVEVTIPQGKTVYDLKLNIQLSPGQTYVKDSWISSLGNSGIPSINSDSNSIEYIEPKTEISATRSSNSTITYTFQTSTIYVKNSPFSKNQISTVNITWKNSSTGETVGPAVAKINIGINKPILLTVKSQRNITKNQTNFSTDLLTNADTGDELEYQFNITNNGPGNAYNVSVGDVLPNWLTYVSTTTPQINVSGQKVSWTIGTINEGAVATATIRVRIDTLTQYPKPNNFYGNFSATIGKDIFLGPFYSNEAGYDYVSPIVSIYPVDESGNEILPAFIEGETINYEIKVVIKKGTTAYSLYINSVILPAGQRYVPNSLTSIGGAPISPSTPTLAFPNEGTVYSASEDRIIIYNFKVIAGGSTSFAQAKKEVETYLHWKMNLSQSISQEFGFIYEYETSVKPVLTKSQGLTSGSFVESNIEIKLEDLIYYKLEVQNPSSYPIYNVNIVDDLPSNVIMQSLKTINLPQKILIKNNDIIGSTKLEAVIQSLLPSETVTIIYTGRLRGTVVPGNTISSVAIATYSTSLNADIGIYGPLVYGPVSSTELSSTISTEGVEIVKESTKKDAYWEENVNYSITVKIPKGMQVYNLQVFDQYDNGIFFAGPAYLNGEKIRVEISGGKVRFPKIEVNNPNVETILKYTYLVSITVDPGQPTFEQSVANNATLYWYTSPESSTKFELFSRNTIIAKSPNISIEKLQRNKTQNGVFDTAQINVKTGDVLEFKLVIHNTGPGTAYNVESNDILNEYIQFQKKMLTSIGEMNYYSNTKRVEWSILNLPSQTIATAIFEVNVIGGISAFGISDNSYTTVYYGQADPSISSSNVEQKYPPINIELIANKNTFIVGDIVTYNILVKVPNGMVFYNLNVQDILPVGQTFISSNLNGELIESTVQNQLINFPIESYGTGGDYNYEIKARIESVDTSSGIPDTQINSVNITWELDSSNNKVVGPISDTVEILASENLISTQKLQKIKSVGDFSTENIEISSGEEIQYKIIITNTGNITAYNISVEDILNTKLEYMSFDSSTQGGVSLKTVEGQNTLTWNGISQLSPGQDAQLVYTVRGDSSINDFVENQAKPKFAIISGGEELVGTLSNQVVTNILVGTSELIQVQKLQRIKNTGEFVTSDIEISNGEEIEYKLVVTNGTMKTYKVEIQDMLNNNIQFIGVNTFPDKGSIKVPKNRDNNVLIWNDISQLKPNEILGMIFTVKGVASITGQISNQTTSTFAVTSTGNSINGEPSNRIFADILVGDPNFITINKLQRIKELGSFSTSVLDISSGEEIQYKLIVTNNSEYTIYNIKIEDILDNKLQFVGVDFSSIGLADVQIIDGNNVLVWNGIDKLNSKQTAQLKFTVKGISETKETVYNQATSKFAMTSTGSPLVGLPSNKNIVNILVGDSTLVKLEKFQKIKGTEKNFSADNIEVSSGEEIEYKLNIINVGEIDIYNINIEDILNSKLQFINFTFMSKGVGSSKQVNGNNVLLWNNIGVLKPKESAYIIYEVKANSSNIEMVSNRATQTFSVTSTGDSIEGLPSNEIWINILVGDGSLLQIEKLQRINEEGDFSTNDIEINTNGYVEYKIRITNTGKIKILKINVEDSINENLEFVGIISASKGVANLNDNGVLIWNEINELLPNETQELVYLIKVISKDIGTISNQATSNFALTSTGSFLEGVPSNEVFIDILGERYTFIPANNNYVTDNTALGYGIIEGVGNIGYILINNYNIVKSYNLKITEIPFNYNLFINGKFIQEVQSNTIYNKVPGILHNVEADSVNTIQLEYDIPKWFNLKNDEVNFEITINLIQRNDPTTIESTIKVGEVTLDVSYETSEYNLNENLFLIRYEADVSISKGINVYDLELKAFYPPSCIFESAYKNGVKLPENNIGNSVLEIKSINSYINEGNVTVLEGELIYPTIKDIDATNNSIEIKYSYILLQYKNTPLNMGALIESDASLSFRTSKKIQQKITLKKSAFESYKEELECVYVNKVFGKCAQNYVYKNITIPIIDNYRFKEIIFYNPKIIDGSLSIIKSNCGIDFSKVKYDFIIPYIIVYQGCGCLSSYKCSQYNIKRITGKLDKKNININLYTPKTNNIYSVVSESIVKNIFINEIKTEFCVCISVLTSSIAKDTILVNNFGKGDFVGCCDTFFEP